MISKRLPLIAVLFVGFASIAFAVPPGSPYDAGDQILDPNCNPGDVNCYVDLSTHGQNGLQDMGDYAVGLGGVLSEATTSIDGDGVSQAELLFGQSEPLGAFAVTTSNALGGSGDVDFNSVNFSVDTTAAIDLTSNSDTIINSGGLLNIDAAGAITIDGQSTLAIAANEISITDTLNSGNSFFALDDTISGLAGFSGSILGLTDGAISNYAYFADVPAAINGGIAAPNTTKIGYANSAAGYSATTTYNSSGYRMEVDTVAGGTGSVFVAFTSGGLNVNDQYTLPVVGGANGETLISDGVGGLTWGPVASLQLIVENPVSPTVPTATGDNAVSIGETSAASGDNSFSAGYAAQATDTFAVALGKGAIASAASSTAVGNNSTASAIDAVSIGTQNTSSGLRSLSFGYNSDAFGENSIAIGTNSSVTGNDSVAIGTGVATVSYAEIAMGINSTAYASLGGPSTFNAVDRLLVIGNGATAMATSDAFTILKNGKTGIGYDNFETTTSSALLQVNGAVLQTSATNCTLVADTDGEIQCAPSDEKLKQNVAAMDYGLKTVLALKPVTYEFIDGAKFGQGRQVGFLAQDLEQVVPEVVTQGPDYKSVNYGLLTSVLTNAIQELNAKIDIVAASAGVQTDTLIDSINETVSRALNSLEEITATIIRGTKGFFESLSADTADIKRVNTDQLCIGTTCVTEAQLQQFIQNNPVTPSTDTTVTVELPIVTDSPATDSPVIDSTEQQAVSESAEVVELLDSSINSAADINDEVVVSDVAPSTL